jgi:hypothetical protein
MKKSFLKSLNLIILLLIVACSPLSKTPQNPDLSYLAYQPQKTDISIDRGAYFEKLQGFWLGTSIANWTGLVTEMDKIGNIGEIKTGAFYTREDWGKPDQPSIWGEGKASELSSNIDFVFADVDSIWGADDDTDIEYLYQEMLLKNKVSILNGAQIREGWMSHIKKEEENFLWVSNQKAFDLMQEGLIPPQTGDPKYNPEYEMIDAQLTTEIFGLYAPARPDVALLMALLPIQTTSRENSQWISEFYVSLFSLASAVSPSLSIKEQIAWMAEKARKRLPPSSYAAKMYSYVKAKYDEGISWEACRDSVYYRYQVKQADGYDMTSRNLYCNGCFAAGINFAASLISLFYGEGDFKETLKIGTLSGWDSDNPSATWGGLLGFMIGKRKIEQIFNRKFSNQYDIHRTRIGFAKDGIDSFEKMALKGIWIIDRVVQEEIKGGVDLHKDLWYVPPSKSIGSPKRGN